MKHLFCLSLILFVCCQSPKREQTAAKPEPEIVSLLGVKFFAPTDAGPKMDSNLTVARKNFEANPSEENYIWLGRRTAYLTRYNEAIKIFSEGIEKYPNSYKLYRHRGHRYISQRKFDEAISDFEKAVELMKGTPIEIEPDGVPNKLKQPLSSVQFNIWYHLALAHYLKGEFDLAEKAYVECLNVSDNDDLITATVDWLYMTYCRNGKPEEAKKLLEKITDNMTIVENDSYYKRLAMYKGLVPADSVLTVNASNTDVDLSIATQGYGVGNWYLCKGDTAKAKDIFTKVVTGKQFSAFGFIAAESDLAKMNKTK